MVNKQAQEAVQKSLDSVTGDKSTGVAGIVFVAVDKNGEQIVAVPSGNKGTDANRPPMDLDTVFWIASCTKLLTTIACMQAVEQGFLKLDDHTQVYKLCPELEKIQVLKDDGTLEPKKHEITLRHLLTHTSGFGYEFFSQKLRDFGRPVGFDVLRADIKDILKMPLVHQPGETWEYGIGVDWAGIILERATGTTLNDWIQKSIAEPLGLKNMNMFPTAEMKQNLAYMHQRWPGSTVAEERDHIYREPLIAETEHEKKHVFQSGGAGVFAKPAEYAQVLAVLLNDGTSPITGSQILKPETVDEMFQNQIPQFPDFARQGMVAAKPEYTTSAPEIYPQAGSPPQGWGLSFMLDLHPGPAGRGQNTAWWAGLANLFWWCDREKGVAGIIASQIVPFGDVHVMGQWGACEAAVYQALGH